MPSPDRRGRWAWLRSQGLGLLCGVGAVLLLAVGSFAIAATRDGASAGLQMDEVRPFFERPSWIHLWFYLLVGLFGLYALNTVLATWHSVAAKVRAGVRSPARYAPAVLHVAFLLALAAHGVGGLLGGDRGEAVVATGDFQPLPGGGEARLLSLAVERMPNGMPREVRAEVERRDAAGRTERAVVGYNRPLSRGLGSELHLLEEAGQTAAATLELAGERCSALTGGACRLAGAEVRLVSVVEPGRMGPKPIAQLSVSLPGRGPQPLWLVEGHLSSLADGRALRLLAVEGRPAILLRVRSAPGNPWALASALVLVAGVALLWRRFLPRAPTPAPEG
jgi:hypothetical protein